MKTNVGNIDKTIRLILAFLLGISLFFELTSGFLQIVIVVLIVILLATSFIGFCGLYRLFGIDTCNIKEKDCD